MNIYEYHYPELTDDVLQEPLEDETSETESGSRQ